MYKQKNILRIGKIHFALIFLFLLLLALLFPFLFFVFLRYDIV